ncbi:MAG TPA: ornithine carbamoyltransferase [Firmicutes bacterium]|nr:ornithine carbamoyltransferase [Bacillota bacterium]
MNEQAARWPGRDLLALSDYTPAEVKSLLRSALELKEAWKRGERPALLAGRTLAMIFEKPSNRTRVSFDVGMYQLGGHAIYLGPEEVGLGARETVEDVARVLSRFVDGIVLRTFAHGNVTALAHYATVPVINGLDDLHHPCQALADFLTLAERFGGIEALPGLRLTYLGDGNNVCHSLLEAGARLGVHLTVATPLGYEPNAAVWQGAQAVARETGAVLELTDDPVEAVAGAQAVYTDTWTSMGQEAQRELRRKDFAGFQVNAKLLEQCPEAVVLHCLPAHYGEEITSDVAHGERSLLFDQAENRLHAEKAVLVALIS